jgi:hypothetical protein
LAAWGSPAERCLAGLFHSAYGAEGGAARARDANLERRGEVRAVIGLAAKELAYLYSALERRHLFGNAVRSGDYAVNDLFAKVEVPVSETTLRSLFEFDAANFVEGPLTRFDESARSHYPRRPCRDDLGRRVRPGERVLDQRPYARGPVQSLLPGLDPGLDFGGRDQVALEGPRDPPPSRPTTA